MWLKHYHYNIFALYAFKDGKVDTTQNIPIMFNFRTNDQGDISSMSDKLEPTVDPIEFIKDENGNIKEAKFIQPNGIFIAKRK